MTRCRSLFLWHPIITLLLKSVRTFLASCIPCRKLRFCHCLIDFFLFFITYGTFHFPVQTIQYGLSSFGIPSTSQRIEQAPFSADHREIFFHFLNIFLKMFSDIIQISFHCLLAAICLCNHQILMVISPVPSWFPTYFLSPVH